MCEVAVHIRLNLPENAATKFAIRTVLREAINKSKKNYKGNKNRKNCFYISQYAQEVLDKNEQIKLIADHAIPVSLALRGFEKIVDLQTDSVIKLVSKYSTMALITRIEDARLRELGLVKNMPENWDGVDIFARYKVAGIKIVPYN
ncbi:MAG: hypothetical protein ABJH08_08615 [Balneola sp.]